MTTPATTKTTRKSAAERATKPAAKRASKSSAKLAVVPEPTKSAPKRAAAAVVEALDAATKSERTSPPKISDDQTTKLAQLNTDALAAVDAFETFVIELIESGVSPSVIGKQIERGNSSIRRIAMRRSPGLVK